MQDRNAVPALIRFMARSFAYQLTFIPEDRWGWKPEPAAKSAGEITGEVIAVFEMSRPVLSGQEPPQPGRGPYPAPPSAAAGAEQLVRIADEYAAAFEAAGAHLERIRDTPFGPMWAARSALFPLIDLTHHHGQITYIQSLLGDAENHADPGIVGRWFGPPQ